MPSFNIISLISNQSVSKTKDRNTAKIAFKVILDVKFGNTTSIFGAPVAQWVKHWPTDLAD